jgi:hypothetical protein
LLHTLDVKNSGASSNPTPIPDDAAASSRPGDPWMAETLARQRALRAAVLIDAIRCLIGAAGTRERRSRQVALRWILSRETRSPFSFNNVCECLGFEPSRVRRLLLTPSVGVEGAPRLAIAGGRSPSRAVRRPRRSPIRYVLLEGGRKP